MRSRSRSSSHGSHKPKSSRRSRKSHQSRSRSRKHHRHCCDSSRERKSKHDRSRSRSYERGSVSFDHSPKYSKLQSFKAPLLVQQVLKDLPVKVETVKKRSHSPLKGFENPKEIKIDEVSGRGGAKLTLINVAHMPCDIGVLAASFLTDKDVAMLSCCDVLHRQLGTQCSVWKMLYKLRLSNQKGAPALTDDLTDKQWRLAYLLQRHNLYGNFYCATTGHNFFNGILGIPLSFSKNPKTNAVDYISSSMDLMSLSAIRENKSKKDVWGNSFDIWIPLYFTKNHFVRALPFIQDTVATLARSKKFHAEMVLDVFPKIFNTYSVLLSDEGVAACQKTFDGFAAMHRLFLALVKKYKLAKEATRRVTTFMKSENERIKSKCPSLGHLIPFLLIIDVVKWSDFMTPYLQECFDRQVLWSCKAFPELAHSGLLPSERVWKSFEGAKVSLRLLMFQASFQKLFCTGNLKSRSEQYDNFLAQPRHLCPVTFEKFQEEMKAVMAVDNYFKFFEVIGMTVPTLDTLDKLLRYSINSSVGKGYHSPHTDFSRIHASGTSRILNQTHSMQLSKAALTHLTFQNTWAFEGCTRFLDSSCLMYADQKQLVGKVDYRHISAAGGAMTHSGDVMGPQTGKHTMQINLELLPHNITALFFVLSAWSGTLKDILKPAVSFFNTRSEEELCQYNLEAHNKQDHQTAVIMCKLYRSGYQQSWHVLAIGESCGGRADQYDAIEHSIARLL